MTVWAFHSKNMWQSSVICFVRLHRTITAELSIHSNQQTAVIVIVQRILAPSTALEGGDDIRRSEKRMMPGWTWTELTMAHGRVTAETLLFSTSSTHIVHPKMTILSSFTHAPVITNLFDFLSTAEQSQKKIFWMMFQQFLSKDESLNCMNKNNPKICFFSIFVFDRRKKCTVYEIWNDMRVSNDRILTSR